MSTLILNANTSSPLNLVVQTAGEGQPQEVGTVTQSFIAADRSSVRGVKRNYSSLTTYVDTATKDSIINLLKWGNQIPCSGDLLANIQTQCTVRYTGCRLIPALGGSFWEVGLSLSEVQSTVTLLRYQPGDTITGESFTRSTTGYYIGSGGTLAVASINAKRDNHWIAGVRSILLEDARTNNLLWSNDFNNAAWVKTTCPITTGIADPAGGTSACTLTASAANSHCIQTLAAGASAVRTNSAWIRRRTGTGSVFLRDSPNTGFTDIGASLSAAWQRFSIAAGASTARILDISIATNGDAIDVWCAQNEEGAFKSSEIPTTTVAITRGADTYSLPFTIPPQELTCYIKFLELGTLSTSARVFEIGNAAGGTPRFLCFASGGFYTSLHHNGTGSVTSAVAVAPAIGDTVELVPHLFGDGSDDIVQSINAAASTSSTQSAVNSLASAWVGALCYLNSIGTTGGGVGFTALRGLKILAGARSLSEMRAA